MKLPPEVGLLEKVIDGGSTVVIVFLLWYMIKHWIPERDKQAQEAQAAQRKEYLDQQEKERKEFLDALASERSSHLQIVSQQRTDFIAAEKSLADTYTAGTALARSDFLNAMKEVQSTFRTEFNEQRTMHQEESKRDRDMYTLHIKDLGRSVNNVADAVIHQGRDFREEIEREIESRTGDRRKTDIKRAMEGKGKPNED